MESKSSSNSQNNLRFSSKTRPDICLSPSWNIGCQHSGGRIERESCSNSLFSSFQAMSKSVLRCRDGVGRSRGVLCLTEC